MKAILFTFVIINICILKFTYGQPVITYQHCYGGTLDDASINMIQTRDRGFLLIAAAESNDFDVSNSKGLDDVWLIKLDSSLNLVWKKNYGGTQDDEGTSAIQTPDGGFVIVSNTESNDGDIIGYHDNGDVWVFKIDSLGILQWQKCFGGTEYESGSAITLTSTNQILITGSTMSSDGDLTINKGLEDIFLIKLDLNGNFIWTKTLGGSDDDAGFAVIEKTDHTLLIAGNTSSDDLDVSFNNGSSDIWIINVDSTGTLLSENTYGGPDEELTTNFSILNDGNYFFAGITNSITGNVQGNHGNNDIWTVVVDSLSKNIVRQKCYGGTNDDEAFRIYKTIDDTILVVGYSNSNNGDINGNFGDYDSWIFCIDTNLTLHWQKSYGGSAEDAFTGVIQEDLNTFVCSGYSYSNDTDIIGNHSNQTSDVILMKLGSVQVSTKREEDFAKDITINTDDLNRKIIFKSKYSIEKCKIEIRDLSGHVIISQIATFFQNVPLVIPYDFHSGTYIASLLINPSNISSKKIVIR